MTDAIIYPFTHLIHAQTPVTREQAVLASPALSRATPEPFAGYIRTALAGFFFATQSIVERYEKILGVTLEAGGEYLIQPEQFEALVAAARDALTGTLVVANPRRRGTEERYLRLEEQVAELAGTPHSLILEVLALPGRK